MPDTARCIGPRSVPYGPKPFHLHVLLTNDLDFPRILAHTKEAAPSVILMRGEPLVPEVRGPALLSAIEVCRAEITDGAIITLDSDDRSRARPPKHAAVPGRVPASPKTSDLSLLSHPPKHLPRCLTHRRVGVGSRFLKVRDSACRATNPRIREASHDRQRSRDDPCQPPMSPHC